MISGPILLAVLAQGPILDADNAKAGIICADAWAVAAQAENVSRFVASSAVGHYLMQSAAAGPQDTPFLDRVSAINRANKPKPVALTDAQALMPQCDTRFPMARMREPARLPADPLDRDMLCFAVLSIQLGAAKGLQRELNDDSEVKRWEPIQSVFSQRLQVSLERGGMTEAAIDSAFNRIMLGSLQIGNADSISRSCALQSIQN